MSPSNLFHVLLVIAPSAVKVWCYRHVFGWSIGSSVRIGLSWVSADQVVLGDKVRIGHFNVIRKLRRFEMGNESFMLNLNTFTGSDYKGWAGEICIGDNSKIMSRHYFDASGSITIGKDCTIGGRDSHLWSHSLTKNNGVNELVPLSIEVANDVYLGARATLVGCSIADGCIVGAGAVVTGKRFANEKDCLIVGNPAMVKKREH